MRNIYWINLLCSFLFINYIQAESVISISELYQKKQKIENNIVLLDVDSSEIYNLEHIDGAYSLPIDEIPFFFSSFDKTQWKDKTIVVYCRCSVENEKAKLAAKVLGEFLNPKLIFVLHHPQSSAYIKWKEARYPIARPCNVDLNSEKKLSMSIEDFKMRVLSSTTAYFLIDCRETQEYKKSHIKNSKNIPLGKLLSDAKKGLLPKDKDLFVYCQTGYRSLLASKELRKIGYNRVFYLEGGIDAYVGVKK